MAKRCVGCMKMKNNSPVCEHCGYNENIPNYPHQLPIGTVLRGQYMVGKVLGQGGFGITYIGWDNTLDAAVAIKEYYPGSFVNRDCNQTLLVTCNGESAENLFRHNRDRFVQEAKILAKLSNVPGIVRIHSLFEENNTAYIVMDYIQGIDLKRYIQMQGRVLTTEETFSVIRPVMYALSKVHEAELVHRDISPDNIMIQNDGSIKLLDFGAAREVIGAEVDKELPQSTEAIIKHGFAPMEQYRRRGSLGPWTDVYSLCATMYYCLTGKVPNSAPERIMGDDNVNWQQIPGLSPEQIATLEKGLSLMPENRTSSVRELWQGLLGQSRTGYTETARKNESEKPSTKNILPTESSAKYPVHTIPLEEESPKQPEQAVAPPPEEKKPEKNETPKAEALKFPAKPKKKPVGIIIAAVLAVAAAVGLFALKPKKASESQAHIPETIPQIAIPQTVKNQQPEYTRSNILASDNVDVDYTLLQNVPVFGQKIYRDEIASITFLDTLHSAPKNAWDVSESMDQSVLAWVEPFDNLYHLYIAGDGSITAPQSCNRLFAFYDNLTEIHNLHLLNTESVLTMDEMFRNCEKLLVLDVSGFDTSNVTNMGRLFFNCSSLTELDVRNFDTSSVLNMNCMFYNCSGLTALDVRNFDTSKVMDMTSMFNNCINLTALDVSSFDTSNVTNMYMMFGGCSNITQLDVTHFDTSNVTDMGYMFHDCRNLIELNVSSFDTALVTSLKCMFCNCESLTTLDVSNFRTENVITVSGMFSGCNNLVNLTIGQWDTSGITDYDYFLEYGRMINGTPWEDTFQPVSDEKVLLENFPAKSSIDEIEEYRKNHKTYTLSELRTLTDDINTNTSIQIDDNTIIKVYFGSFYKDIDVEYYESDKIVYRDDYTFYLDNPQYNVHEATYEGWVVSELYSQMKLVCSSSGKTYYWCERLPDHFYDTEYADGYATRTILTKEFFGVFD